MTKIISAFPCLGKTTLTNQNKDRFFDMEVFESRATKGMSEKQKKLFFRNSAENIKLIFDSGIYECIFVTDDERLLDELRDLNLKIIHILPNPNNEESIKNYRQRVIARSGIDWYNKILAEDLDNLNRKITKLTEKNEDIRFVGVNQYIGDVAPEIFNKQQI